MSKYSPLTFDSTGWALLAALLVAIACPAAAPPPRGIRTDRHNDPLPTGAAARLGSMRLRHLTITADKAFTSDGRTMATLGPTIRVWEVATGRLKWEFRHDHVAELALAFSPDDRYLVSAHGADQVYVWDLTTGKRRALWTDRKDRGVAVDLAFSPDGRTLAVNCPFRDGTDDVARVRFYDFPSLKEGIIFDPEQASDIDALTFSPDGRLLAFGAHGKLRVWDIKGRKELARIAVGAPLRTLAFRPDGKTIAIHPHDRPVSLIDWRAQKVIRTFGVAGESPSALRFLPDGKTLLFAPCHGDVTALDPTGERPLQILVRPGDFQRPTFDPKGKRVALENGGVFRIWDLRTGQDIVRFEDHRDGSRIEAIPSPDSRRVATRSDTELRIWDLRTGTMQRLISGKGFRPGLSWTSDGQHLVAAEESRVGWWNAQTGRLVRQVNFSVKEVLRVSLLSGGKRLVCATGEGPWTGSYRLLDKTTGKVVGHIVAKEKDENLHGLSPDGRHYLTLQSTSEETILRLRDAATGRVVWDHKWRGAYPTLCFSGDGRLVGASNSHGVQTWETVTGRMLVSGLAQEKIPHLSRVDAIALSPDGRMAAVSVGQSEEFQDGTGRYGRLYRLLLIETATSQVRRQLLVADGRTRLSFSADGRWLVTDHKDGTGLVWDVYAPRRGKAGRLWEQLADGDAEKAFEAVCRLCAEPDEAVKLLASHLKPVKVDEAKIKRLLTDLDSESFARREAAFTALAKLGEAAEPLLQQALGGKPSLELNRRIRRLLARLEPAGGPGGWQRARAVEVLEQIGTPLARRTLRTLAEGTAGVRLTEAARAALRRLEKRKALPRK